MLEDGETNRPLVFISYSHSDVAEVSRLRSDIIAAGIKVWWDKDILGGQDWKYEIREAMRQCDAVILCLSERCLTRSKSGIYPEALDTITAYREYKPGEIFLIPVRFSECRIPSIEIDGTRTLDRLQYIDLFPHERWSENLQKVIASIECAVPPPLKSTICTASTVSAVSVHNVEIEITIDRKFELYTEADQARFLRAIRELLEMDSEIIIKRKRPGSVKLTLELSLEQAQELLRAIKTGHFKQYDVIDAELKEISESELTSTENQGKIQQIFREKQRFDFIDMGTAAGPRAIRSRALMPSRILLVEDQVLIRQDLRALVEQAGMVVIGEASDGQEALRIANEHTPDVAVLDIAMPHLNGLEIARRLRETVPQTKTIVLTMHTEEPYVLEALQAGTVGYVLKTHTATDMVHAIREALQDAIYLSPGVATAVVRAYLIHGTLPDPLTSREREIVQRIAEGQTTKEIAAHLGVSVKTVESHRINLMRKLDIHETATLVRYAIRWGLTTPLTHELLPDPLTSREREIVQRIAEGQTTKEIAAHLGVSVKTVESHRINLMRKLDIHETATLVRYAIRWGLTTP